MPSQNDADNACLADPLLNEGDMRIQRGLLTIDLHYWLSCGSYGVRHIKYLFRHEQGRMRLIGKEDSEYSRSSGERDETSTNYLTGKEKITTGRSMFEESAAAPKVRRRTLQPAQPQHLETMPPAPQAASPRDNRPAT